MIPTEPSRPALSPLPWSARRALALTVVLTVVYVALDIVAQLLPPHYNAITQAESDLAVGPFDYVMTVNFVVRGVLSLAFLFGLHRATSVPRRSPVGVALVAIWAVGAFLLAAFPTDVGTAVTVHGTIHLVTAAVAFLAGVVGALLLSLRFRDDLRLAALRPPALVVSTVGVLALLVLFYVQQRPGLADEVFGLVERVLIGSVLLWMLLVSLYLLRSSPAPTPCGDPDGGGPRA